MFEIIAVICLLLFIALVVVSARAVRNRLSSPMVIVEFGLLGGAFCLLVSVLCGFVHVKTYIIVTTAIEGFVFLGLAGLAAFAILKKNKE